MPSPPGTALAAKLLKITEELGPIPKSGFNAHFQYAFYREEDFIDAVRPLLVKHGVVIIPNVLRDTITPLTTSGGATQQLVSAAVEYLIIDVETGDSVQAIGIGHGADSGDKGLPKALTGAMKAFLRQAFMISAGSADAEDDQSAPPMQAPSQQQYQQQPMPQQQARPQGMPPTGDGGVGNATGFCPTHQKPFRLGNKGNRYCATKIGQDGNGQPVWCNQGYEYDQQFGRYDAQGSPPNLQPAAQPAQQQSSQQPEYSGPPMDVDDIPF